MTQLKTFKCDRCGKEFNKEVNSIPDKLIKVDAKTFNPATDFDSKENRNSLELDLCIDCDSSLAYWIQYYKEFDKVAEKLALKETGED